MEVATKFLMSHPFYWIASISLLLLFIYVWGEKWKMAWRRVVVEKEKQNISYRNAIIYPHEVASKQTIIWEEIVDNFSLFRWTEIIRLRIWWIWSSSLILFIVFLLTHINLNWFDLSFDTKLTRAPQASSSTRRFGSLNFIQL